MKLGFIGLGTLGRAIAQRLIEQGNELVVWNRTANKAKGLGAQIASTPAEVLKQAAVTFFCLFDSPAVEAVLTRSSGVLAADCAGKIICDITTNHFQTVNRFHTLVSEHGGAYLETPVLGSVAPALSGNLVVLVSGEEQTYLTVRPTLEQIGSKMFYLPEIAAATKMKLINNVLLGSFMTAITEATVLAEKSGITKETALDIFGVGAGNSGVLNAKREALLKENFSPTFAVATIHKDLTYLHDLALHLGVSDAMASTARAAFAAAIESGFGSQDLSVVYRTIK